MHIIQESDILDQCIYCGKEIQDSDWNSIFFAGHHYKIVKCKCGKENSVKCKFHGSGHDEFTNEKDLEIILKQFRYDKSFFKK